MYNAGNATNIYAGIPTDTPGFRDFVKYIEGKNYLERQPSKTIYHYTDANGLKGMVENKNFWCTDIQYMNDANELTYAKELIANQIDLLKRKNKDDEKFFEILKSEAFRPIKEIYDVYVTCFCEVKDLLSQWRGYGRYCIGFGYDKPFRTDCHLNLPTEWPLARLRKVEYSKEKQKEIINEIVDGLYSLFTKHIKTAEHDYEVVANWYGGNFSGLILEYLLSFKDPTFSEEKEWRLIHLDWKSGGNLENKREVEFRTKGNHLIPFIKSGIRFFNENKFKKKYHEEHRDSEAFREHGIGFDDYLRTKGKFPINSVGLGPMNHLDIAKDSVNKLLKKNGFEDVIVNITDSKIRSDWL